ncbi:MAG: ribosomal protein [Dehalococcoidia bacterium]|nr:ribosomal protein [Dehalococcoidia bacterium]
MAPLPKKKRSKARLGPRRAAYRLSVVTLNPCPQCHSPRRPHRLCPVCGYYRGREVIAVESPAGQ